MNWFQRYGIPGAYFVALTAAWLFVLSPQTRAVVDGDHTAALVGLAVLVFLPIGYVISVLGQVIYLRLPWALMVVSQLRTRQLSKPIRIL